MKIYVGHNRGIDFEKDLYDHIRKSDLFKQHEIIFSHDLPNKLIDTKDIIKNVDLVLAEVSYPSTGLGIELGWANTFGRNIICIYKKGTTSTSSLKFITKNIIEYKDSQDMIDKISMFVNEMKK